ncbi:MAG: monovalent cation/H(+) antiporter subunit G [Armatimonadota bacterium]|nr:monovalent cation/H(+) antiporter subunit G [Armatimonadota bacterium]MDR7421904.1 monovalent cation/H(+) antiporter subunit G [Armatimonadota bacterium]MDR7454465.1 monovalent cation/H(+) antiporter subunit G [Armatimonadota bacterium]MDR7457798.1 monovalent cation/H(+) antiporter subunit G [Armatimonadota bacterium]MDR7497298.1 monovalent cation/H(+) antiporter subunit G [Armatimonadota bacterium]
MSPRELLTAALLAFGAIWILIAAAGIVRMPDLYLRMSASSKAATLGAALMLLAVAVHFQALGVVSRVGATVAFILLTAPVAAHMIARAAYVTGVPLWRGTMVDELRGRYDPETHALRDPDGGPARAAERPGPGDGRAADHSTT